MHISVADSAKLDVEGDVLVPSNVPLDWDLLKLGVWTCFCPSNCVIHCAYFLWKCCIFSSFPSLHAKYLWYNPDPLAQQTFMTRDQIQLNDHSLTKSGCFLGDRVRTRQWSTPSFMGHLWPSTHAALRIENATLPTPSWWAQESAGSATKISGNVRTGGTCFTHITDILWTSLWVSVGVSQSVSPLSYLPICLILIRGVSFKIECLSLMFSKKNWISCDQSNV